MGVSICNHQVVMVIWDNLTDMIVTLQFLNNSGGMKIIEKLISLFSVLNKKLLIYIHLQ
jgi:hypothetical protein